MPVLTWDGTGQRFYETGVDRGVLYLPDSNGAYTTGVAWNGLTQITESPSGAEASTIYADNIAYGTLSSAEKFSATIEAYTYPVEFAQCDGTAALKAGYGLYAGQQPRKTFGLSYRTRLGNDVSPEAGYKLRLVYGLLAAPSEKTYQTINESPEAITFSWECTSNPTPVTGLKPTSILTIQSNKVSAADLKKLEDLLYGSTSTSASLPLPDAVVALFTTPPPA